jgi:alkylhydroperoxidase family enzyme
MTLRIKLSNYGNSNFQKILGHNKSILDSWNNLDDTLFSKSNLEPELIEQVRRSLAFINKCEYCMVKAGRPNYSKAQKRISFAVAFAEFFAQDHLSIKDDHFNALKDVFSESEISELSAIVSFISCSQRIGRIFNLSEEYQPNKNTSMSELFTDEH